MPKKTTTTKSPTTTNTATGQLVIAPIPAVATKAILAARVSALAITQEILDLAKDLAVETEPQYHSADEILHKIKVAQKRLDQPFEDVIRPVRQGLDGVYAIRREVENPLIDLERTVKEKMRAYKLAEAERIRKEEAERARVQREAEAAERRRVAALPKEAPAEPQAEIVVLHPTPVMAPVRAASSSARTIKRWRVYDFEQVIECVKLGLAPVEWLQINAVAVEKAFKLNPALIDEVSGMECYDDIQIAGR